MAFKFEESHETFLKFGSAMRKVLIDSVQIATDTVNAAIEDIAEIENVNTTATISNVIDEAVCALAKQLDPENGRTELVTEDMKDAIRELGFSLKISFEPSARLLHS